MTAPTRPRLGDPAPDITAIDAAGEPWRLDTHRGRHVVVIFHRHIH